MASARQLEPLARMLQKTGDVTVSEPIRKPHLSIKAHRNDDGTTLLFEFALEGDLPPGSHAGEIFDCVTGILSDLWTAQWTDEAETTIEVSRSNGETATGSDLARMAAELAVEVFVQGYEPKVLIDLRPVLTEVMGG